MRILSILVFLLFSNSVFTQDYFENRLFIKVKDEQRSVYSLVNDVRFEKILPRALVKSLLPVSKHPLLSSTYELILNESYALDSLVAKIQQLEQIEYAEKVPLYKLFFTPNDPLYSTQWNLAKIQADLAWNLGQGCTQVKIAVTDDGFLMNHEDLVNQWHINTGEINGNGIDDDGNGYIDDWRGWDAANNDNDPSATAPTNSFFTHGTHVAGIVAAQTHNNKGIAAIGYNCKMIPVKIGLSPSSSLTGAFQGLDYAINASGCDVINMSWGGGAWSATFQTLFNIAKSKGIICVAAAGNSNTSTPMYPASYNHVISVAASGSTDARASFSNFGSTIDVTAPGVGIPSCLASSITSYGNLSGTSMASPLVAGLCGLMKCYNPMPADSIEACLKRTCDNINAQNPTFIGQLGAGRINAFQALQCLTKKPKSDFIALDTFQCPTKAVRYQAKSFGIPTLTYSWSFPGGNPATSTSANPIVTYATAGYKSATLITCNSLGCDTMTKTNYVNIDTPKAWLNNRVYTTINAMNVVIAVHFKGRSPFSVTLTDGSNTWTQTNIQSNPYLFSIQPKKDTSILSISSFSDSSCAGNKYGQDTIYRKLLTKDTTICVTLKTSQSGALDGFGLSPTSSTNITWTFANNENVVANWTAGGSPHFWRCILKFNLSNIPANAVINSASLSLYSKPNASHGWSGQPTAGTDNSTSISRITNSWTTTSIATNAWPSITTQNQVILAQSPTNNHSYTNVNVKNLIQDLINNGDNGIFLRHVNTPFYNSLIFYSAEETDTSKHPKLVLCYTIPAGSSGGGGSAFCRDSLEVNSAQTGWQALQTNGTWGSLTSCNYVTSLFTANAANFPGMNIGNCLWGPIVANPSRTYYNSSSQTSTSTSNADIAVFRKEISIPAGALIDSVRLWMLSDDFVDSVFINSKNIYTTPIPITYGQVLFTKKEVNIGTGLATNYITIKAGDLGGNYGHYFRMKVYYSKVCNSDCDTSGLVLCMSMDGNANDSTKYNHHGIVRNATLTTGRNGIANTAYYFNGTSSHISLGIKPMLKPSSATISVWVKPHTFNSYTGGNANCILLTKNPNNPGSYMEAYSLYLTNRSGPTKFMTISTHQPTTNEKWFLSNQNTSLNQWTHLVLTFDYDSLKLYINGQLDNKTYKGFNNVYDALDSIMIGYSANTMNKNYFKGDMDELKMYNRVLTSSEVQNLYSKPFTCSCTSSPPPSDCDTSGLVLCMSMDGNANDSTKYAHHGIVRGATPTANRFGINNSAYSFNGISNYISLGNKSLLKPNKATISMWVKPNSISTSGYGYQLNPLFVTGNTNSPGNMCEAYFMGISTNGNTKFHSSSWNPSPSVSSGGFANQSFSLNAWHHMTTTFDNDSLKIYINGVLDKSFYKGFATNYSTIDSIIIAYSGNNTNNQRWFNGSIDDIKMFNRVLTAAEVQNLYSKPFTCSCTSSPPPSDCDTSQLNTGKVLHLDFNGNTQDKSGNNNHATNYGATPVAGKDGVANTAYRFNGTSNYMQIANSSSLNNFSGNKITLTAILKPRGFYNGACKGNSIIMKGNSDYVHGNYLLRYSPNNGCNASADTNENNFYGAFSSAGGCSLSAIHNPPYVKRDTWYCLVSVYTGDSIITYINGIRKYSCQYSGGIGSHNLDVFIGKLDNATYPYWLNADVDDIRIYNRVLAPSEVKGYCGTCNTTPTQLICNNWLKTLNTNDRVTVGDLDVTGDKLTVEALVNQVDTGSTPSWDDREIVSKHSHGYNINYNLRSSFASVTTDSSLNGKGVAGADFYYTSAICKSSLNKTYHIAMVYDGVKLSFYRNGFLMSQVAAKGNLITNNLLANISNYAGITTGSNNHSTKGYVNEVRIWNVARTQSQIKQFMSDTLPNPASQTGLLGYYRFDNLLNKQGNPTFNGTIVGGAQINQTNPNCTLVIDSCDINSQPPVICDTSRRFTYTQCLNDSLQVTLRAGSQYQWSPKLGLSSDTVRNPKIYVTANQRYLVSYLGAKGCQVIDTIDISVRPSAIYPKMEDQLICIGDSVQMTIPIYATNVQWSPNTNISSITANNPFFYPTVNTTYYLQFRDTFGCLHKDTFVVNTKVCCPARARFSIPKELLCFGEDLTITNRSKGPITGYNWNFSNANPNSFAGANPPVLKFPAGGTYPLRLIVTNGICFDTMTKIVTVVQVFPNAGKDTTNCLGAFVTDLGESPISDWTYKWTPTIYLDDPNIANPKCSIVNDSVNYVVEVTDRNSGCKSYDTVVVYTNRSIDSTAQNLRICNGDSVLFNGIQRKTTGNYYFTIKKADGFCDSFINILRLNVLQKQVIPLDTLRKCEQYIDSKGKKHIQSFIENDTIKSTSILNCDSMVYIRHVYIYKKVYRDRPSVSGCAPFRYNGKTYTESKMRVDSLVIRNIYLPGCDTIEYINVIVFPKPKAMITPSIPNPVLYKQTVTLSASGGQRYFWLQTGSTNQDIDYKINNTQPKLFTVRVTDENECWDTVSYLVKGILPDTCYYGFPNVFSPNQDNLNDEYIPNMDECTDVIVFAIYDRWGEKVFETNQLKGWNGYFKGRPAPMGVYLYYAEFNTPWGIRKHKGTFTLMR